MTRIKYFLILFFIIFSNCSKEQIMIYEQEEEPKNLLLYPEIALVGFKISIIGQQLIDYHNPEIIFPGNKIMFADSMRNDTIYTTVPYSETTGGNIIVKDNDHQSQTNIITIINHCPKGVCIQDWNLNYSIKEKDSYFVSEGFIIKWSISTSGDTTLLQQQGWGIHSYVERKLHFLESENDSLPIFVSGYSLIKSLGHTYYDLENSIFKIQNWDKTGIRSGKIFCLNDRMMPSSFVFWVNTSE